MVYNLSVENEAAKTGITVLSCSLQTGLRTLRKPPFLGFMLAHVTHPRTGKNSRLRTLRILALEKIHACARYATPRWKKFALAHVAQAHFQLTLPLRKLRKHA